MFCVLPLSIRKGLGVRCKGGWGLMDGVWWMRLIIVDNCEYCDRQHHPSLVSLLLWPDNIIPPTYLDLIAAIFHQ